MRILMLALAVLPLAAFAAPTQLTSETRLPATENGHSEPTLDSPAPDFNGEELPVITLVPKDTEEENRLLFENLRRDPVVFALVAEKPGLSFHKPMFILPYSWTDNIRDGEHPEAFFEISFKQRLLDYNIYVAYSQKSFWQVYDGESSRPFRETDYNPELFYRHKPNNRVNAFGWDLGVEHESNGRNIPDSRSWNRIYGAGYWEGRQTLAYLKLWYRLPEAEHRAIDDPERDDNPDINDYYGYGELQLQRNLFGDRRHRIGMLSRLNPRTGKGAIHLNYSAPLSNYAFWNLYLFHGYGESLIDYDRETSRLGIGMMFSR